jgi:hypothetical protein
MRQEIPSLNAVPFAEHCETVREYVRRLLEAWREGVEPSGDLLGPVQPLVRRRVYWGVPLHDLLRASQVGAHAIWDALREASLNPEDAQAVVELAGLLMAWTEARTSAVATAYLEEVEGQHGRVISLRHRLLEALSHDALELEAATELARGLGFDPDGGFQALCGPADEWPQERIDEVQRAFAGCPGTLHCGIRGQLMVGLAQGVDTAEFSEWLAVRGGAHLGVGLRRDGLEGASWSMVDAERALSVSVLRGQSVSFEREWLIASLTLAQRQLEPLIDAAAGVARDYPELAETVSVFFETGLSLSLTAKRLFLHRNGVVHRLNKWRELTSLDPRSMDGLLRSVVAANAPRPVAARAAAPTGGMHSPRFEVGHFLY